eukprot:SAG22_NODE_7551_length_729_cov_1.157143_2_plen_66_part_01
MAGWDVEKVWEDTLSLGEQQRLGMARMYFNLSQKQVRICASVRRMESPGLVSADLCNPRADGDACE